jgi:Protein of unknown function (DUF5818)
MRNLCVSLITAALFFVTAAFAQSTPASSDQQGTQGTASASPATSSPSGQGQSSQGNNSPSDMNSGQTGQNPGYGNPAMNQGTGNQGTTKGDKKLKGCVQSQDGQYMLQTRSGKTIPLTGQDVSAHAGHEVALHGTWAGTDMSNMSGSSGNMSNGTAHTFNVTSVDMISDSCTGGKHKGASGSSMQQQ